MMVSLLCATLALASAPPQDPQRRIEELKERLKQDPKDKAALNELKKLLTSKSGEKPGPVAPPEVSPVDEVKDVDEKEAKARLQEFARRAKGAKDEAVEEALRELATARHPLILKELLKWAAHSRGPKRVVSGGGEFDLGALDSGIKLNLVAAECVAAAYEGDEDACRGLAAAIKALASQRPRKQSAEEQDLEDDLTRLIESVAQIGCRSGARDLVPYFKHPLDGVAASAMKAAGQLKSVDAIEPLIQALSNAERMKESAPDLEGMGGGSFSDRKSLLTEAARSALAEATGQSFDEGEAWARWWKENKGSFRERP